jgi:hypothetical protein
MRNYERNPLVDELVRRMNGHGLAFGKRRYARLSHERF